MKKIPRRDETIEINRTLELSHERKRDKFARIHETNETLREFSNYLTRKNEKKFSRVHETNETLREFSNYLTRKNEIKFSRIHETNETL